MKKSILIFTAVEAAGLIGWFTLISNQQIAAGLAVLFAGLLVEHFIAYRVLMGGKFPAAELLLISASESALWILWLAFFGANPALGVIFLFITMFFQHSIERNIFKAKPLLDDLVKKEIIGFTFIEAAAAGVWLVLASVGMPVAGAAVLTVSLFVEHVIQSRV